ncbi:MAG TPA: site-specific integrase [Leptospiraceae bacterium]|nr:site-specific integrase [Leptospirales bacterium]HMW59304.1 site-specific integrase [Leptospiraceae bacterium]HMY45918.1 site-specific integrase [Leptospiraceae bacterium]HNN60364.1 site-specific integrase [Leptospiraceae bacterium]HNN75324.1 site-specific integrase [Leptospiraceae bacterium]
MLLSELSKTGQPVYDSHIRTFNTRNHSQNISAESIQNYIISLEEGHFRTPKNSVYSLSSIRCVKSALKKSISISFRSHPNGYILVAAIEALFKDLKIATPDQKVYSSHILNQNDIESLIRNSTKKIGLMIRTLAITGMRISEMLSIRLNDSQPFGENTLIRIVGKRLKERQIMLPSDLFHYIVSVFQGSEFLFENANKRPYRRQYVLREISRKGKKSLNRKIGCHTLRHSFITMLIDAGISLKKVSQYVGHSSTDITSSKYVHHELNISEISSVFGRLFCQP